jgi:hypothetical protein
MSRYVLTYSGGANLPSEHLEQIRKRGQILDQSLGTLLVDAPDNRMASLAHELPGWKIEREQSVPVPDTRKKIKKPALNT